MSSDIKLDPSKDYFYPIENDGALSDQIWNRLLQLSEKDKKRVSIENSGSPIEIYHYGNESAKIIKRLHDATVGEDGGEVRYYAEWADYRRFNWWKNALKELPIYFLELPINDLAIHAGIQNPELIFSPEKVIENYHLNPKQEEDWKIACMQWVQDRVVKVLNANLAPNYRVMFLEGFFRMIPLTPEAKESRLIDNEVYNKAADVVLNSIESLKTSYAAMSQKFGEPGLQHL